MSKAVVLQFRRALKKAESDEMLSCYVRLIRRKLRAFDRGQLPTLLDAQWVDYFLRRRS